MRRRAVARDQHLVGHQASTGTPGDHIDLAATLSRIEATLIARAMKAANGNKTRAAEALGLNRTTLLDKLKRVGTEQPY